MRRLWTHLLSHETFTWPMRFPPLLRVIQKIAISSGVFLLVTPLWPAQKWFPAVLDLQVMDVCRLPVTPEVRLQVGPSASPGSPSSCLEDFWRLRGLSVSDAAFPFIGSSWRPSTVTRYDSVWRSFKDFLSACGVLLLSVDLTVVLDYLTLLADRGLAYSTIALHRSVLSATLPPVDGHEVGHHPLISRLLRGIFQNLPPTRRFFASWNVAAVFAVFSSSSF